MQSAGENVTAAECQLERWRCGSTTRNPSGEDSHQYQGNINREIADELQMNGCIDEKRTYVGFP
jgi:hypothetical protein